MKRIFSLLLSTGMALAGLSTMLLGLPSSIVIAEQPAKPEDVILVNVVGEEGQITEHRFINSPSDTDQERQNNIGIGSYQHIPEYHQTFTSITSDRPDPSKPGERIDVNVLVRSSYGTPSGTVMVRTNPSSGSCSMLYPFTNRCSLSISLPGRYTITAVYQGNSFYAGSSDTESHTVEPLIFLDPPIQSGYGIPGAVIDYEIQLQNKSSQTDSYTLTLGAHSWETMLSDSQIGPVEPGEAISFTVSVNIPQDAVWYDTDSVVITAASATDPTQYLATAQATTRAYAPPQISVDPVSLESTQAADQIVTQTLNIRNGNGIPLTFEAGELIDDDLVAYYPFDGNASDYSGHNNDGIVMGAELTTGVCGIPDNAYEFDGLTHYIQVARSTDLDLTGNLSMSAWIFVYNYPETFYSAIVDKDFNFTGYNLHIGSNGQLHVRVDGSYVEGGYISINQWHHVVGTYDGQLIKAYIDGVKIGETSEILPTGIALKDLFIGSWQGERVFDGRIDDVRIYERALSEGEILLMSQNICNISNFEPWISLNPTTGTVPNNDSLPIQVTFDATGLQPGEYTTTLYLTSNDPLNPLVSIPVRMGVVSEAPFKFYIPLVSK